MTITQLQYFVVVSKSKSFVEAAKKLFISQPTLSYSISTLETELNCTLINRNRRSISLTTAGTVLLSASEEILEKLAQTAIDVRYASRMDMSQLRVGFGGLLLNVCFARVISPFIHQFTQYRIVLNHEFPQTVIKHFNSGALDVVILGDVLFTEDIDNDVAKLLLEEDRWMLVVPEMLDLPEQLDNLSMLGNMPLIVLDPAYYSRTNIIQYQICAKRGYYPETTIRATFWDTVCAQVASGAGVSILPHAAGYFNSMPGVRFVRLTGNDIDVKIYAYLRRDVKRPAIDAFETYLRNMNITAKTI